MSEKKEKSAGKTVFSMVVLVVALVVLVYGAPKLQTWIAQAKESKASKELEAPSEKITPPAPQSPRELQSWIPLVEQQLPDGVEFKYRLVHMRLSEDTSKLLLDIEKTYLKKNERFDLILERDEFGRYISEHQDLPMKLYPPEAPKVEAEEAKE